LEQIANARKIELLRNIWPLIAQSAAQRGKQAVKQTGSVLTNG
jgi:hypothetical protein